ncbi:hypothetical protein CEUSTIGMA_g5776.t1 [Chlamydomonas eustigma]|uniref:SAP domain-containing protein n=1 Tax=Chlamydomonas eustigma TaxID=1157962 RepID=A0A250X5G4_9CHLO|nr:hypothetical protein CEUSTIGMA_g5776.t1 [Chlamydomonas eustigma]|eukprot:GAX78334.1 hypothetical protein CEUSTIGMA_g5776.t1 [Chlamydomonas eustigma]
MSSKEECLKMTVPELKAALKAKNLPLTGKKDDLISRLLSAPTLHDTTPPTKEASREVPVSMNMVESTAVEASTDIEPPSKHDKITFNEKSTQVAKKVTVVKPAIETVSGEAAHPVISEADKQKLRADRFQDPEVEKAKARAQRFNLIHPEVEKEKTLKRAERFGLLVPELEEQKKKTRAERFGILHPEVEEKKKQSRAERFGIVDEDTKVAARKDKFKPLTVKAVGSAEEEAKKLARAARFAA